MKSLTPITTLRNIFSGVVLNRRKLPKMAANSGKGWPVSLNCYAGKRQWPGRILPGDQFVVKPLAAARPLG